MRITQICGFATQSHRSGEVWSGLHKQKDAPTFRFNFLDVCFFSFFLMVHRHFLSLQRAPDTRGNDPGFRHTSHSCRRGDRGGRGCSSGLPNLSIQNRLVSWFMQSSWQLSCFFSRCASSPLTPWDVIWAHTNIDISQRSGWLEKNTHKKKEHLQLQLQKKTQMTQDTDSRASRSCSAFAGAASSPWRRNLQLC